LIDRRRQVRHDKPAAAHITPRPARRRRTAATPPGVAPRPPPLLGQQAAPASPGRCGDRTPACARAPAPDGTAGSTRSCAACLPATTARRSTETPSDGRAGVRTNEVQPTVRPLPTTRTIGRQVGVAAVRREPQPAQAPQPPDSRRRDLNPRTSKPSFRPERPHRWTGARPSQLNLPFPDGLPHEHHSSSSRSLSLRARRRDSDASRPLVLSGAEE
jgi:hypothetical protein